MNVLVTGANGFIGSNLTHLLVREGHRVKAMVFHGTDLLNLEGCSCEIVYADITKPETLTGICNDIALVFHLAALPSLAWGSHIFNVNYEGTKNILEESVKSNVRRFVFMSSLVVHGFDNYHNADETTPLRKVGFFTRPYIASKIRCEELLGTYKQRIETVIIRPGFNIYGPNDRLTSGEILHRLDTGKLVGYANDGECKLGYVFAGNLVLGLFQAGNSDNAAGQTYIIADYRPPYVNLKSLLQSFGKELGITPKITAVSSLVLMPAAFLLDAFYFMFLRRKMPLISTYIVNTSTHDLHFTSEKAIREIGYKQEVSFEEGIKRTVEWYQNWEKKHLH